MTVQRINGCPPQLDKMSTEERFTLVDHIGRNQDQIQRELDLVNTELLRRALNSAYNPAS
jgi:hypothetical protein